ncbi:MAG: exodeoxyribonuclease VII large subunit [Endomicrobium sp.]|uniref:exodeoxyribonuclease VII large subunit n=1 Tax=Candidatus Endomicrobiellum pyrsonymphae TaxID=1408203 RepID=UPI003587C93A|nr:exodeoxyribonuclease VII large subunit [Endomicrobium sp.]
MFEEFENNDDRLVYTVTQISNEIKLILEDSYQAVWIQGEISNFKLYNSGHMYFSVKDANAQIKAVMFQNVNVGLKFALHDGMKVLVYGRVSSYPKSGDYQIIVNHMEQYGKGELYEAYEQLKKKLELEGLFDESVKKVIPDVVNRIGIVTSQEGAALHDILKVIDSLNANVEVLIYPVRVQGKKSEKEISQAIKFLNAHYKNLDVLLVGRGGGSIEDLWSFNTESVARAIFDSEIPVVSCVGHETDFTIADFVADMRAPTPSAAAEMILRKRSDIKVRLEILQDSLNSAVNLLLDDRTEKLDRLMSSRALLKPHLIYEDKISYVDEMDTRLLNNIRRLYGTKSEKLKDVMHKLDIVSPLSVLKRGFSVCFDSDNKIVKNSKIVNVGDNIRIKLALGSLNAEVKSHD